MTTYNLSNKVAVVTGGASGIGKAISLNFAENGAHVFILELDEKNGHETVSEIQEKGGKSSVFACNVANHREVIGVVDKIARQHHIDILVNNAGIAHVGNIENTSEEDIDRLYQVNIKGVYNCIFACIPHMKKQGGGVILNMASIASTLGISDRFAYSMSKGAVLTMTYSVAKDYIGDNIRCNCISPARVHTPFVDGFIAKNYPGKEEEMFDKLSKTQPIGRMGTPEEIAALALFLCSDQAGFITGTDYPIDGGFIKLNS
ncbi:MAG: SDR family oxidoreductase [Cytophagales bacterium]|nr:SDR family oxidoreductase [Cytophagales bacterium]